MASNPYLQNPLVAGLGALGQGLQAAQQVKTQKSAQQAAMQRQAMLDAAKASLDKSQAGNYDASAYESRAKADNLGTVAGNTRKQDLMSEIDKVNQRLPDLYTVAVTRGDRSALDQATQYRDYLMSQLQGGGSPQGAPSGIPSPTGGQGGNLGGPSFAGPSLTGGNLGDMRGVPSGMPSPMGGSAGNLGVPSVPAGVPPAPFAQQLQDASKPQSFDVNSLFGGIPKSVQAPAYVPPKLVTPQGVPQQAPAGAPDIPQAPQQVQQSGLTNSPLELSQLAQADEAKALAKKNTADALAQSIKNNDVTPILEKIRIAPRWQQPYLAKEANDTFDQLRIQKHIPVPGTNEFPGYYTPDSVIQSDLDTASSNRHNNNLKAVVDQAHAADERAHMQAQDKTAAAAQAALAEHQGNQDTLGTDTLGFKKDTLRYGKVAAEQTKQQAKLDGIVQGLIMPRKNMIGDTTPLLSKATDGTLTISPGLKGPDLSAAQSALNDVTQRQKAIDTLGSQSSSNYGNLPTNPLAPSYIDKAIQACKATGAGGGGHCDKLARISTEKTDPVNAQYFDRSPGATALTTLRNFQNAGKAFPLKPGMALPPGTLVFSTKLGKGAGPHGSDAGHVAMIGSDGQPNDQHNKNQIALGKFNYFVPPSGSAPNGAPRGQQKTAGLPPSGALKSGIKYKITGN